jgi:hypothetical protein
MMCPWTTADFSAAQRNGKKRGFWFGTDRTADLSAPLRDDKKVVHLISCEMTKRVVLIETRISPLRRERTKRTDGWLPASQERL